MKSRMRHLESTFLAHDRKHGLAHSSGGSAQPYWLGNFKPITSSLDPREDLAGRTHEDDLRSSTRNSSSMRVRRGCAGFAALPVLAAAFCHHVRAWEVK